MESLFLDFPVNLKIEILVPNLSIEYMNHEWSLLGEPHFPRNHVGLFFFFRFDARREVLNEHV